MKMYELMPTNGRKSFYGKACVYIDDDGSETLPWKGLAMVKAWKVYGREGHRQRESFCDSRVFSAERDGKPYVFCVFNSDITNTNEYTIVVCAAADEETVCGAFDAHLSDGVFENSHFGKIVEIA